MYDILYDKPWIVVKQPRDDARAGPGFGLVPDEAMVWRYRADQP